MTAHQNKPHPLDRESIHDRLFLFGTIIGLMADHPENFGDQEPYALQMLLYETAKAAYPTPPTIPADLLKTLVNAMPACKTPGDVVYGYQAACETLKAAGWEVEGQAML